MGATFRAVLPQVRAESRQRPYLRLYTPRTLSLYFLASIRRKANLASDRWPLSPRAGSSHSTRLLRDSLSSCVGLDCSRVVRAKGRSTEASCADVPSD